MGQEPSEERQGGGRNREVDEIEKALGAIVDAVEGDPFANLSTEAPEFRTMTFTVTHDQHAVIERAIKAAIASGLTEESGNENKNGNALALIAGVYVG